MGLGLHCGCACSGYNSGYIVGMSCDLYTDNSVWSTVLAAGFGMGIFLSYMPQLVTILLRQSTEGINPYFLMLMNLGSSFAFANVVVLSRPVFSCCRSSIGVYDCFSSLLGVAQLFAGFFGPLTLLVLSVRFREPGAPGEGMLRSAKIVLGANIVSWLLVAFVRDPVHVHQLGMAFGITALSVGFVQYIPQLVTTYRLKHTGSLSVVMMLIQIPGGYIWCLSLALRKGSHWSTWVPMFAAASFQTVLLVMALYYSSKNTAEVAGRIASPAPLAEREREREASEHVPLLRS